MKKLILFFRQLFCKHYYRYTEINHDGMNTVECKYCGKRKSIILFLALAFVMCGCDRIYVGNATIGKKSSVPIQEGNIRLTITKEYIIIEQCTGYNGYNMPWWECTKITDNDTIVVK